MIRRAWPFFIGKTGYHAMTTAFMTALAIPDDSTVFYPGTAQEITGHGIWVAVNDKLVIPLHDYYLASICPWLLPFVGGTSARHRTNLIDPAFGYATESGTFTHDQHGSKLTAALSGIWRYTSFTGEDLMPTHDSCAMAAYITTDYGSATNHSMALAASSSGFQRLTQVCVDRSSGIGNTTLGDLSSVCYSSGVTSNIGLHLGNRTASNAMDYRVNDVSKGINTVGINMSNVNTCNIYAFGRHSSTCATAVDLSCVQRISLLAIFNQGLTAYQSTGFNSINTMFHSALFRYV